ncbi:alpha/beta hydrolase family protein [Erythrobacter litoralis]|uniref:Peptidase S9 prolyl oligopeptidase catalytic domain-containing protein n=1 Tax=Erythrobacter litoralis (strain HTCC2594) TaxID=314225 RepID=Q2NB99_ERYLH|nr:alpha/beta hydrolase [Erythrobacter litoralis]ABC63042.1 hypothetical protein ELI_04750 [Erythrobacter litoralis HTCC2594]
MRFPALSLATSFLFTIISPAAAAAAPVISTDHTVAAVDERVIHFYVDRPDVDGKVPLLVVIDGSGCLGQRRPSSWGDYAPTAGDPVPFARLMIEKPGVAADAADPQAQCSQAFHDYYTIQNRVLDHLRVLQHLQAKAPWWDGRILLWGWSDGGDIGAQMLVYRPDIERAVLGAMGGGLTMAEHFERFWACPPEMADKRAECLADLRADFAGILANPSGSLVWNGESHATWASRLRSRLSSPLADNRVPLLIVHGERDHENTPIESARALVGDLEASGNTTFEYWEIAGMGHGWDALPPLRQRALRDAMLEWLFAGAIEPGAKQFVVNGRDAAPTE